MRGVSSPLTVAQAALLQRLTMVSLSRMAADKGRLSGTLSEHKKDAQLIKRRTLVLYIRPVITAYRMEALEKNARQSLSALLQLNISRIIICLTDSFARA
jgi:hypothetical protein